ncbi:serine hydrolase domain-containing protein [Streptomyces sp. GXMU-J15]|uniref:Serine hydrolase domain-containing protein n=1 Tax=Streptomyces fuscus TaxID=3048495 RepID=A0ABT7IQZ0_9ACTN|nr:MULTISPECIES: serine hydrolase domain-containing protein [Streptomyces]MDL2074994.1 serine hydrolase domain-containing protein [Streptomyces fuscus]SBT89722.1 D-alanyl-D-alanine carboxypeptidase [Streptomyces sp. DI166]
MRRTPSRRLSAVALLVTAALTPVTVTPAAAGPSVTAERPDTTDYPRHALGPELSHRLDRAIEEVRREADIPGLVVGLWMPGKGHYVRATGVADTATGRPMRRDVFVRIGSETKTFTVTALLKLVDDGRIGLDDPIAKYVKGVPNGRKITLRHLAEMRSGLFPYTSDPDFVHDLLSDPQRTFTPRQVLAYGFKHKNTFKPGKQFEYCNSNLVLLGLVIEKVTGKRLAEVIDKRVLRPAHLHHTVFPDNSEFPEPHPRGYTNQTLSGEVADATDWNPSWAWAAGAMISNLHDLRRWARVVATGTLLSPRTQAERLKMLPTGVPGTSYGLGIFESGGWIGHNGSIPGYETVTVYLPSKRATLVLMLNTDITSQGQEPSSLVARAITEIITPHHVYDRPIPR